MAYDEHLADRIRQVLKGQKAEYYEKRMFGGLCFMVDDKMCCGIFFNKKKNTDLLMARIGEEASTSALTREGCHPMDFTGRPMKGFVFVTPEGYDMDEQLSYWIQLSLDFNPFAKASKKRKPKR